MRSDRTHKWCSIDENGCSTSKSVQLQGKLITSGCNATMTGVNSGMQNRLVYLLVGALFYHQLALAQIPRPPQPAGAYQVRSLRLIVLEGDNAINSIQSRIGT